MLHNGLKVLQNATITLNLLLKSCASLIKCSQFEYAAKWCYYLSNALSSM